ncbi:MAG: zinc ribbon domain-containing protein [Christensenellales bacterium]|jgi:uncharacterized membrane protein/predicted RNA-binding Zn-ribbon protein involved in translation (DUF1610 family)
MAFCGNCGGQIKAGEKFCPSCGKAVDEGSAQQQNQSASYRPPVMQASSADRDAQENKTMAILAYILFFIPLLTGAHNTSPFVKYHTNQGTLLFIASLAFGVVYWILMSILTSILLNTGAWGLWNVLTTILGLAWLLVLALCVIGIINAAGGQMKPLPIIGKFTVIR